MKALCDDFRNATRQEMEELRHLAVLDLEGAGYTDPPEIAIESRLRTLADGRHLLLPSQSGCEKATSGTSTDFSPGLALVCRTSARSRHTRRNIVIRRNGAAT